MKLYADCSLSVLVSRDTSLRRWIRKSCHVGLAILLNHGVDVPTSFWDRHGVPGECQIVATSFRSLLEQLIEGRGGATLFSGQTRWLRQFRRTQRPIEARELKHHRQLLEQEKHREKTCKAMGLDPYLEVSE